MTSVLIRLAGPLQSWANASLTGNVVRTERVPTRSAVLGLIAAACGFKRGHWEDWLYQTDLEVRVDRAGNLVDDFQTINPRDEDQEFQQRILTLLTGKAIRGAVSFTPDGQSKTSIVNRTYLHGAEFIVRISHPEKLDIIASALRRPVFSPYLGRKAFAPVFPMFLGLTGDEALETLPRRRVLPYEHGDATESNVRIHSLNDGAGDAYRQANVASLDPSEWLDVVASTVNREFK